MPHPLLSRFSGLPLRAALLGGAAVLALSHAPALAQDAPQPRLNEPQTPISTPDAPVPTDDNQIGFAADRLEYDSNSEIVTASGGV